MSHMIAVDYVPTAAVWLGNSTRVAIADSSAGMIRIYSSNGEIAVLAEVSLHSHPVKCMSLNVHHQVIVSIDTRGMIEYWGIDSLASVTPPITTFTYKSETSLYELAKAKTSPCCLVMAPAGDKFVVTSKDKQIRIFDFRSGKLKQQFDESALSYEVYTCVYKPFNLYTV
jgi:peptidylprolyl isomerase domain and WD repeat-containing protein 1